MVRFGFEHMQDVNVFVLLHTFHIISFKLQRNMLNYVLMVFILKYQTSKHIAVAIKFAQQILTKF